MTILQTAVKNADWKEKTYHLVDGGVALDGPSELGGPKNLNSEPYDVVVDTDAAYSCFVFRSGRWTAGGVGDEGVVGQGGVPVGLGDGEAFSCCKGYGVPNF